MSLFQPGEDQIQILKHVIADTLYFGEKCSPDKAINIIKNAERKAEAKGYINLYLKVEYEEPDYDNHERASMTLYGDRSETIDEFNKRIQSIKSRRRYELQQFEREKKMWESDYGKKIMEQLNN